ncbi:hypothetical protein CDD83_10498 [Cordyceps sp. RAO-2017]|nr:hypothetical protein CDD83_10498 [Cordyceps sp. RAO-2017]
MTMSLVGRLSRAALADAEVIAQVDCKFVLVRLPLQAACKGDEAVKSSGLVMIDQHAADERCRLEQLFGEYFEEIEGGSHVRPVVEALDRPVMFEATGREGELLERFREHLESWGVVYRVSAEALAERRCRIQVTHLPPSIMERCRSEPRLVIELMRKEVWALADGSVTPQTRDGRQRVGKSWASRFRGCPSGVLELLYSRSCRSAIMFNDELSREECERLVRRLAGCAFPFQCAHGRPTMAPLTELGPGGGRFGGDGQAVGADRWRRWMGRRGPEATGALSAVTRAVSVSEHGVSE